MTGDANPFRGREKKKSLVDNWLGKKFVGDKKAFQDLYQERRRGDHSLHHFEHFTKDKKLRNRRDYGAHPSGITISAQKHGASITSAYEKDQCHRQLVVGKARIRGNDKRMLTSLEAPRVYEETSNTLMPTSERANLQSRIFLCERAGRC